MQLKDRAAGRPAHWLKSKYFDDFPELLQRIPRSQQTLSARQGQDQRLFT
jgi:hypothetical protein